MQNKTRKVLMIIIAALMLTACGRYYLTTMMYHAAEYPMYSLGWWEQRPEYSKLTNEEEIRFVSWGTQEELYGTEMLVKSIILGGAADRNILEKLVLPYGWLAEYEQRFKEAGVISANYSGTNSKIGGGNNSAKAISTETPAPQEKVEFTVSDVTPHQAWTTQDCNIRSGADVSYEKAGNLKKHEQITVTGQASTGWFRITTSDGKEAYISDTLITTEDPRNREYTTVDGSGDVTTYKFEDTPPEVIDNIIEEIENKTEEEKPHEYSYTSEVTKESTCTEKGTLTYTCECGDTYTEEIPLAEHTPGEWEITKKATILSDGEQVKKCTVCGEVLETAVIPANKTLLYILIAAGILVLGSVVGIIIYKRKH